MELFDRYSSPGDQIKKKEMDKAYSTSEERGEVLTGFMMGKRERKSLIRYTLRWKDNIKIDVQETLWRHELD